MVRGLVPPSAIHDVLQFSAGLKSLDLTWVARDGKLVITAAKGRKKP